MRDLFGRPLNSLRVSVTDACNLRCRYCMPEEEYTWLPRAEILSYEEIARLVEVLCACGVEKVRLTGGEPLVRRGIPVLVRMLAAARGVRDLSLTTNGVLLAPLAGALRDAGLRRITVSLDTLRPERFRELTRRDDLGKVMEGIETAAIAGLPLKINTVVLRGLNDDEIADLVEYGRRFAAEVRFIEYMDVGGATRWSAAEVFSRAEILAVLARRYGEVQETDKKDWAPADRYILPDGGTVGIIASTTAPFCRTCDRVRLTADGRVFLCLYAPHGIDLKGPLRAGASPEDLRELVASAWRARTDRGAEERLGVGERGPLLDRHELRASPHREMHTLGG